MFEGAKGYILIEAYKQTAVKEAIAGVRNLRVGQWRQEAIPIIEMPDLLKQRKKQILLKPGQWVRIRRGKYKSYIAKVECVHVEERKVQVKLLPRIDYNGSAMQRKQLKWKYRDKIRAPAKPFNPEPVRYFISYIILFYIQRNVYWFQMGYYVICFPSFKLIYRAMGGEVTDGGQYFIFEKNRYSRQGFLHKSCVLPTTSEFSVFEGICII